MLLQLALTATLTEMAQVDPALIACAAVAPRRWEQLRFLTWIKRPKDLISTIVSFGGGVQSGRGVGGNRFDLMLARRHWSQGTST